MSGRSCRFLGPSGRLNHVNALWRQRPLVTIHISERPHTTLLNQA